MVGRLEQRPHNSTWAEVERERKAASAAAEQKEMTHAAQLRIAVATPTLVRRESQVQQASRETEGGQARQRRYCTDYM